MNPYDNIPKRPVTNKEKEEDKILTIDVTEPVSDALRKIEDMHPHLSDELRKYTVWAAGAIKQFFICEELWDVMEIMEKWAENPSSVSDQELKHAADLAWSVAGPVCSGYLWIYHKEYVTAYVVYCLTQFKKPTYMIMHHIEQAYKADVDCSYDVIVARNRLDAARKKAELDFDPNLSPYQMLNYHQLGTALENAEKARIDYESLIEAKINEAREPQWVKFNQKVLKNLQGDFVLI